MSANHSQRRHQVASALRQRGLDSLIVTHPANWFYLTGFTGESGALVVERDRATLVTDGRFTVQAKEEARGIRVVLQKGGCTRRWGSGCGSAGCDASALTLSNCRWGNGMQLRKAAGAKCRTIEAGGIPEGLRTRKDAQELAQMRKAAVLAGEVFESVLGLVRPGVRESELAAELEYQMRTARGERAVVRDDCGIREALRPPPRAANRQETEEK